MKKKKTATPSVKNCVNEWRKKKTKTSSINKPTTTRKNSGCVSMPACVADDEDRRQEGVSCQCKWSKKDFPVCQEGLFSVSPSSNNRKCPVCREGLSSGLQAATTVPRESGGIRVLDRMKKEEVVCRLQITNRGRTVSPRLWEKKKCVSNESPWVGRRVSPAINLPKEKEWDP